MKKPFLFSISSVVLSIALSSCLQPTHESNVKPSQKFTVAGFSSVKKNVLDKYCLSCHSGKEKPKLTSFEDLLRNRDAIRKSVFHTQDPKLRMPPRGELDPFDKQLLLDWLDLGSPFNETKIEVSPSGEPVSDELGFDIDFKIVSKEVLEPACIKCHAYDSEYDISDYTNYEEVKNVFTAIQKLSMAPKGNIMPPRTRPPTDFDEDWLDEELEREQEQDTANPKQLSNRQKDILYRWLLNGLKE